ncbi:MAG: aldehyde dehydrogenase family protein, partial [Cypionkella sp.]
MLTGHHLIAGQWIASPETALSSPASGEPLRYSVGTKKEIDQAVTAAEAAFPSFAALSREARAQFLDRIAEEIEARGSEITAIGCAESGLPSARLEGERGRTTGQLRLFAAHIRKGDYLDRRTDAALPDRQPAPRPEIRMMQRPIGPVGVFGASNFPLAFSTA